MKETPRGERHCLQLRVGAASAVASAGGPLMAVGQLDCLKANLGDKGHAPNMKA